MALDLFRASLQHCHAHAVVTQPHDVGLARVRNPDCDPDGNLSLAAVAELPIGKELAEVVKEGLSVEVLSWKMCTKEPSPASVISNAMNHPHDMAMQTSEPTAIAVLKGEAIVQMSTISANALPSRLCERKRAKNSTLLLMILNW